MAATLAVFKWPAASECRLWRRKSSRTRAAQGVRHQWQRQTGKAMGTVPPAAELLVVRVVHGWSCEADADAAAPAGIDNGVASTASEVFSGEP